MIELENLSAEKQEELLEVIKYFNNDKNKFEKEFDLLNIEDKKTILFNIVDEYNYIEDDEELKNSEISFLKKYRHILISMQEEVELEAIEQEKQEKIKKEKKLSDFNKKYPNLITEMSDENLSRYMAIIFGGDFDENFKKLSENDKVVLSYVISRIIHRSAIKYLSEEIDEYLLDAKLINIFF
jgi:hypothetical protein